MMIFPAWSTFIILHKRNTEEAIPILTIPPKLSHHHTFLIQIRRKGVAKLKLSMITKWMKRFMSISLIYIKNNFDYLSALVTTKTTFIYFWSIRANLFDNYLIVLGLVFPLYSSNTFINPQYLFRGSKHGKRIA